MNGHPAAAVVTGAGGGIGSAVVRVLADRGWHVVGVDRVGPPRSLTGLGKALVWVIGDVREEKTVSSAVTAAENHGVVQGLVTATIAEDRAPLVELDQERIRAVLDATVETAWAWSTAVVAAAPDEAVSLVHVSSVHAVGASAGMGAYAMAKAALGALVRVSALEWGPQGVRCNAVLPGFVPVSRNAHRWTEPKVAAAILEQHPLHRFVTPYDVAAAVAFLLGPDAAGITGVSLPVDGGLLSALPHWA